MVIKLFPPLQVSPEAEGMTYIVTVTKFWARLFDTD